MPRATPALLLVLLLPALAGCSMQFGGEPDGPLGAPPPARDPGTLGAALALDARAQRAALGSIEATASVPAGAALRPGALHPVATVAAVYVPGARLEDGRAGTLVGVLQGALTAEGARVEARAVEVHAQRGNLTLVLGRSEGTPAVILPTPSGEWPQDARAAAEQAPHARLAGLDADAPLRLTGASWYLDGDGGVRALPGEVRLAAWDRIASSAALTLTLASGSVEAQPAQRAVLALQGWSGTLTLDGSAVQGANATSVVLQGGTVRVEASSDGALASAQGARAMQVYHAGRPQLPAVLQASAETQEVRVPVNGSASVAFRLAETSGRGDAVLARVDVEGPGRAQVRLPGFRSITQQYFEWLADDPAIWVWFAPAAPAFAISDAILLILDALFGPPKVPQVVEAGSAFDSRLSVSGASAPGTAEAAVVLEGANFAPQRIPLRIVTG